MTVIDFKRLERKAVAAETWRRFHGVMTIIWIILLIPSMLWWKEALPWIVFMSVWANVGTHFGAWQASRAEVEAKAKS